MQNMWAEIKLWWALLLWMLGAARESVLWLLRRRLGLVRDAEISPVSERTVFIGLTTNKTTRKDPADQTK
jgi:hypothetical protein